jgi:hypothetical protein
VQERAAQECSIVGEAWGWEVCSCTGLMMSFDMLEELSRVSMQM